MCVFSVNANCLSDVTKLTNVAVSFINYLCNCIHIHILQMFNLDYEDIYAAIPHYIWASAFNFSLFLYSSKKDTFFKLW